MPLVIVSGVGVWAHTPANTNRRNHAQPGICRTHQSRINKTVGVAREGQCGHHTPVALLPSCLTMVMRCLTASMAIGTSLAGGNRHEAEAERRDELGGVDRAPVLDDEWAAHDCIDDSQVLWHHLLSPEGCYK